MGPYGESARSYYDLGLSPIPVGRDKMPVIAGYHGREGKWVSSALADKWAVKYAGRNIAIRLPADIICLDIDDYEGRSGGKTLNDLEDELGALPATIRSTARWGEGESGIKWFRLPVDSRNVSWPGQAGPGIDIITWFERYAIVPPSLHRNGNRYRWYREDDGTEISTPGPIGDLPELPEAWCDYLAFPTHDSYRVEVPNVVDWLRDHTVGDECQQMGDTLALWRSALGEAGDAGGIHDSARDGVNALLGDSAAGHTGAWTALGELRSLFLASVAGRSRRRQAVAVGEWRRLVAGAVEMAAAEWDDRADPCAALEELAANDPVRDKKDAKLLSNARDGKWLDRQKFAPLRWAINKLVPEGMTLLVGPPKIGKSVLMLRFGLECARGGIVLGEACEELMVHYLALEDSDRRMQSRCREMLEGERIPSNFNFQIETVPGKLIETVSAWYRTSGPSLILVDTLGKAMEPAKNGESTYERDTRIASAIKTVVDSNPGSYAVVSHHSRKGKAEDWMDAVSGTNALAGCADTIIVLNRKRGEGEGVLHISGRDVDDTEYALAFAHPFGWGFLEDCDSLEDAATMVESQNGHSRRESLGDRSQDIMDFLDQHPGGAGIKEISDAVNGLSYEQAKVYLGRMWKAGYIDKAGRGRYAPYRKSKLNKK